MISTSMHDVREVANFVLDLAEEKGIALSNMAINKIVYFVHVDYLLAFSQPLVSAKIEAWDHGPVFRELYAEFKAFGDNSISGRAMRLDRQTLERIPCNLNAALF